jgi:hypothetical protein
MKPGDKVRVRRAAIGESDTVICTVVDVQSASSLPQIPGVPPAADIAEILKEYGIDQFMILSYPYGAPGNALLFTALHSPEGWIDMKRHALEIEPFES